MFQVGKPLYQKNVAFTQTMLKRNGKRLAKMYKDIEQFFQASLPIDTDNINILGVEDLMYQFDRKRLLEIVTALTEEGRIVSHIGFNITMVATSSSAIVNICLKRTIYVGGNKTRLGAMTTEIELYDSLSDCYKGKYKNVKTDNERQRI